MMSLWRKATAECIGTAALIFIGAGSIIMNAQTAGGLGLLGIALAHGLTVGVMVSAIGHISGGHINPAVTAGFLAAGRMRYREGMWYMGAQLAGVLVQPTGLCSN
jgi:glycerol uptake facilitator-like aquaporin